MGRALYRSQEGAAPEHRVFALPAGKYLSSPWRLLGRHMNHWQRQVRLRILLLLRPALHPPPPAGLLPQILQGPPSWELGLEAGPAVCIHPGTEGSIRGAWWSQLVCAWDLGVPLLPLLRGDPDPLGHWPALWGGPR